MVVRGGHKNISEKKRSKRQRRKGKIIPEMFRTGAEDIKKRWQEYTEELFQKKVFMTQIIMMV